MLVSPICALLPLLAGVVVQQSGGSTPDTLTVEQYTRPPRQIENLVRATRRPARLLTNLSPSGELFMLQVSRDFPTIAELARPHYNLAGLRVDPIANRERGSWLRGLDGVEIFDWRTGASKTILAPKGARFTSPTWSPDGSSIALFAHFDSATYLWIIDAKSGTGKQVGKTPALATFVTSPQWTASGEIALVLIPEDRGPAPKKPDAPAGPEVRATDPKKNPQRTYASLLHTPEDAAMLEYFVTGQVAFVSVADGKIRRVGKLAMIRSVDPSPDGKHLIVSTMLKPFSYQVQVSSFGTVREIWDETGKVLAELERRELSEDQGNRGAQREGDSKRSISWRPDGEGLSFLQIEPAPKEGPAPANRADRVMQWLPPFGKEDTKVIYQSQQRISSVAYSADCNTLFLTESSGGKETLYSVTLDSPTQRKVIYERKTEDFYDAPGTLMMRDAPTGISCVRVGPSGQVFLTGTQYSKDPTSEAPRPFLDSVVPGGKRERVWQSPPDRFETVASLLEDDASMLMITGQSPTEPQNSYLWSAASKSARKITNNEDVTPEITAASRLRIQVTRPDGFKFWVNVTLPRWHTEGTKLPAMFWFYPDEYTDQKNYDDSLRTYNKNRFPAMGARSMQFLIELGYAVVEPDCPIVGPAGRINDRYIPDLRNNLYATIDELDRRNIIDRSRLAIGGHSYGAFSTANAMIHTPFFKAGIAGDGNYNRLLTPNAFQNEQRLLWDARETYLTMSPLLWAEQLTGALLMYHGLDDQNVGTSPINSERMFHALEGLGKTAALYMYPYEDHGPVAIETTLDLWARWIAWLEKHVKNAGQKAGSK